MVFGFISDHGRDFRTFFIARAMSRVFMRDNCHITDMSIRLYSAHSFYLGTGATMLLLRDYSYIIRIYKQKLNIPVFEKSLI